MRLSEIVQPTTLDSQQFKQWFANSKVVDAQGNPLPVYHGTARPDRVGNRFRRSRATAGPMAYFTDDPEIASNYAQSKPDTSMQDEDTNYWNWFKVKSGRTEVDIVRLWFWLSENERQTLRDLAPRVTRNDDGDIYRAEPEERTNGLGAYDNHIREARGNVLAALVEEWLNSAALFGDEFEFLKVLQLAGLQHAVRYDDPRAAYPFVYQVFLSIKNPLVSTNVPQDVLAALMRKAKQMRSSRPFEFGWDKNKADPREWIRGLLDDIERTGGTNSWTVIPDWVTQILKQFGYDGIQDIGGKFSDVRHAVWIPFSEHQVKSAISNKHFRPDRSSIHA